MERTPAAIFEELVTVESSTNEARESLERAARLARLNAQRAEAVLSAGRTVLPGSEDWRALEAAIAALPGLTAYADALDAVLARPWPPRENVRAGLAALAEHLVPLWERQASDALGEQLIEVRRSAGKALATAARLDAMTARAAEVTGAPLRRRRWDPAPLSTLRAAAAVSFIPRETAFYQ